MSHIIDLSGKTALITGGATRVGAAIARRLHGAGAHVIVHYRSSARAGEALQQELHTLRPDSVSLLQGDLLHNDRLGELFAQVLAITGRLDILVNNASTYYPTPIGSATETQWDDLMGTNAKAPFFLSQLAAPALRASHGCIINLVDIHADRPHAGHPIYCMAKAANAMLVKSLARDLAPEVRVNGIAPGAILWPESADTDKLQQEALQRIPLGRPGTPDDIARSVLFLAGSDYISGQVLAVDGGRSVQQ